MNGREYFKTAKEHLISAKKNFKTNDFLTSYKRSIDCGEVALKAVLIKNGIFNNSPFSRGGDRHHNILELFNKIKEHGCLPGDIIFKIENIIGDSDQKGLGYIDLTSPNESHMDCFSYEAPNLDYPVEGESPYNMADKNDASKKIMEAEQLINLLTKYFDELPKREEI